MVEKHLGSKKNGPSTRRDAPGGKPGAPLGARRSFDPVTHAGARRRPTGHVWHRRRGRSRDVSGCRSAASKRAVLPFGLRPVLVADGRAARVVFVRAPEHDSLGLLERCRHGRAHFERQRRAARRDHHAHLELGGRRSRRGERAREDERGGEEGTHGDAGRGVCPLWFRGARPRPRQPESLPRAAGCAGGNTIAAGALSL